MLGAAIGSGRLGADVGGVITVGGGAAVATLFMLPGGITKRAIVIACLVPVLAIVGLAALDLATGGNGHFTRTVLHAHGKSALSDIVIRRYELAFNALKRGLMPFATLIAVLTIVYGIKYRRARLRASRGQRSVARGAGRIGRRGRRRLALQRLRAAAAGDQHVRRGGGHAVRARRSPVGAGGPSRIADVRIALVSPYSWTYPGGVTRHIEALAGRFLEEGHEVRVLAPLDPPDRLSARLHRGRVAAGARAARLPRAARAHRRLPGQRRGVESRAARRTRIDAAPRARRPATSTSCTCTSRSRRSSAGTSLCSSDVPLVGTFHCYSDNRVSNNIANLLGARRRLNRLPVRIAVSEAAAWTGRRFFGGHYRVIPNGVDVPAEPPIAAGSARTRCEIVFVGQAVERKGLPVLLRAFEALREIVPARLTLVGAGPAEIANLVMDDTRHRGAGQGRRRDEGGGAARARTCSARRRWAARASGWS